MPRSRTDSYQPERNLGHARVGSVPCPSAVTRVIGTTIEASPLERRAECAAVAWDWLAGALLDVIVRTCEHKLCKRPHTCVSGVSPRRLGRPWSGLGIDCRTR